MKKNLEKVLWASIIIGINFLITVQLMIPIYNEYNSFNAGYYFGIASLTLAQFAMFIVRCVSLSIDERNQHEKS